MSVFLLGALATSCYTSAGMFIIALRNLCDFSSSSAILRGLASTDCGGQILALRISCAIHRSIRSNPGYAYAGSRHPFKLPTFLKS